MKKGISALLAILIAMLVLHGCHAHHSGAQKTQKSGFPVGHDLHPDTQKDDDKEGLSNGGFS